MWSVLPLSSLAESKILQSLCNPRPSEAQPVSAGGSAPVTPLSPPLSPLFFFHFLSPFHLCSLFLFLIPSVDIYSTLAHAYSILFRVTRVMLDDQSWHSKTKAGTIRVRVTAASCPGRVLKFSPYQYIAHNFSRGFHLREPNCWASLFWSCPERPSIYNWERQALLHQGSLERAVLPGSRELSEFLQNLQDHG